MGDGAYGGALYIMGNNITVKKSCFNNNSVYNEGNHIFINQSIVINIDNCSFYDGTYNTLGSGIFVLGNTILINNSCFVNNSGRNGGALRIQMGSVDVNVVGCNFTGNKANFGGGAIYSFVDLNVVGCNFTDNVAGDNGGAIYSGGVLNIARCNFTGNNASDCGGALYLAKQGNVLNGTVFMGNRAVNGSAVYMGSRMSMSLYNVTLEGNVNSTGKGTVFVGDGGSISVPDTDLNCGLNQTIYFAGSYCSDVLYVGNISSGDGSGLTMDDLTTFGVAFGCVNSGGRVVFVGDVDFGDVTQVIRNNVTIVGNNSNVKIKSKDGKYLFILERPGG